MIDYILKCRLLWATAKWFGIFWLIIEPLSIFIDFFKDNGVFFYGTMLLVSFCCGRIETKPRTSLNREILGRQSKISIFEGDILGQESHLVIGINDVFDTELGDVIKPKSVQGQFTQRMYNGDVARLNTDLETALEKKNISPVVDEGKAEGKNLRYPVGTTVTLGTGQKFFMAAYSFMGNDLKCNSTVDELWHSMNEIWREVRLKGQGETVATPVIGSDLARTGLTHLALIQMIIISFIAANKREPVAKELQIVIYKDDVSKIDFVALEQFLSSLDA